MYRAMALSMIVSFFQSYIPHFRHGRKWSMPFLLAPGPDRVQRIPEGG
jgi:hypothetical protein